MPKSKSVSKRVTVVGPSRRPGGGDGVASGQPSYRVTQSETVTRGPKQIHDIKMAAEERYQRVTTGLSDESKRVLADMRREATPEPIDQPADMVMGGAEDDDAWEDVPEPDSAVASITYAIRDLLESRPMYRKYRDQRTWRQRVRNLDENWRPLLPQLVDAYVHWRYGTSSNIGAAAEPSDYDFDLETIDIYNPARTTTIRRSAADVSIAEVLVRNGFLGTVPLFPSRAVSLKTLELLRIIRLFKPSFSIEAFTKVICHVYVIPYRRYLRTAIGDAYDIYLTILRFVRKHVVSSLGRDSPDWRVKNACPACSYKQLEGESPATFSRIVVMDGNNSLKRMAPSGTRKIGDARVFDESDYFLPTEYVEQFAHEVRGRQLGERPEVPVRDADNNEDPFEAAEQEGDPTDGQDVISTCTRNWKAAAADDKKRMWAVFEETGIFACACRHGLMLYLVDMIRSGELAKYPLAIVAKLCATLGERMLIGYDVGCSFLQTIAQSSLGETFNNLDCRMCVNAFHGYSHAYPCQVQHHPNVIAGAGLEDLETLERIFSASNQLAPVTCYASAYRRRVLIDEFFQQWDDEKYQNIGLMLYNNYVQALDIIETQSVALTDALRSLQLDADDLRRFQDDERRYFAELRDEEPSNLHAVAYVEALQDLQTMSEALTSTSRQFLDTARGSVTWAPPETGPTAYYQALSQTRKLETKRRTLRENIQNLTAEVVEMEARLNITNRWQPGDVQYEETLKYIMTRKYQKALGKLQRLVIQRLFELHKLNLSQTAYRVRSYIAKNLQTRCKAIRQAVNDYNAAAAQLNPPRPPLDWSKVSHFSFLEEFSLLDDTRNDIRNRPWASPAIRETMRTARRVVRASKEIDNVNREIRRLHTAICDEETLFTRVLRDLQAAKDPLYGATLECCQRRRSMNAYNLAYIQKLYDLKGFTGTPGPGIRAGTSIGAGLQSKAPAAPSPAPAPVIPPSIPGLLRPFEELVSDESIHIGRDEEDAEVQVDEEDVREVSELVEHMSDIAVLL
ncbi:hypothetical protein BN946_scf184764.g2 [Trametes cinnabarina]|uniref:CxC1-like cysteine cluster associated with KDZ transposases domain-containing protein n=1 Tax=Pycnoporus cinnabarinus TaxID=5643 RepID=A0A060SJS6_PYCCI|nr:hypothetical protein BN946_scf184764.g2 [Trametes cinnabarina]